jgi:Fungal protein kinase
MADLEIIKSKPIGEGLNAFHSSNTYTDISDAVEHMHDEGEIHRPDARLFLTYIDLKDLVLNLILALQGLPAARLLRSPNSRDTLKIFLLRLSPLVESGEFDIRSAIPLLTKVLDKAQDVDIWDAVYDLVTITESTPPPRPLPYLNRTPISFNTGSLANTSEYRKYFDSALKDELDSSLYVDVPGFFDAFFGGVTGLQSLAEVVFKKCQEGEDPLYKAEGGWHSWPKEAPEKEVLDWFKDVIDKFLRFTEENGSTPKVGRRPLGQLGQHLSGSTAKRKLDIGFANGTEISKNLRCDWSQILVPGELKSNPNADKRTDTWLDLARYARHVLTAQDTRRFVLGFTLCGSIMRLWEFDRLGGIASSPFDINKEGLQFVSTVLGYLWMNEEQLGFDPTILESDGKRYMEIMRNNKTERLVIIELIKRHSSVAGRATTTWKAYCDGDESKMVLVIKDSWQYPEREEEGELLREATKRGVVNVARYYHHETVHVGGKEDDINGNVRKGLAMKKATDAFLHTPAAITTEGMMPTQSTSEVLMDSRSRSTARKRSSSSLNAPLPPHKRSCSTSPHVCSGSLNRVHRRVIVRDYGKHIYKASSQVAMLAAIEGNIEGMKHHREPLYLD